VRDRSQVGEMRQVFERLAVRPPVGPGKPVR
jgi:hypothetical protein